jgi:hypothetical protein
MTTYICDHADPEFSCYGCPHSVPHEDMEGCGNHQEMCWEIGVLVKCVEWENDDD